MKRKKIRPAGVAIIVIALIGLLSGIFFVMGDSIFGKEVAVPDITGMTIAEANKELGNFKLILNVYNRQYDDKVEKDVIILQDPVKGRKVKEGKEINVTVSLGSELIDVPDIKGKTKSDAQILLRNKDLDLGDVDEIYDEKYEKGVVISQKPLAGDHVKSGSSINVVISQGKQPNRISMPDLKGLTLEKARKKLEDNKLLLVDVKRQASNQYYAEQVAAQDTEPGVLVDEGFGVNVVVSTGPGPVAKTRPLEFNLPSEQAYYRVVINVNDTRGEREVYSELHRGGDPIKVLITYLGSGTIEVLLDGNKYKTYKL